MNIKSFNDWHGKSLCPFPGLRCDDIDRAAGEKD
jgi:hypothetical protein